MEYLTTDRKCLSAACVNENSAEGMSGPHTGLRRQDEYELHFRSGRASAAKFTKINPNAYRVSGGVIL
jgi:hypothetical protein